MRIVTWNCNGALRRKLDQVDSLQADILVIQECEDPASSTVEYRAWARQYLWAGANRTKGIGIFLRNGGGLERLDWPDNGLKQFLPAKINGQLDILAVWTKRTRSSSFSYIGQFWNYLKLNRPDIHSNLLICGDFNSSTIWDKRMMSHGVV